MKKPLFWLVGVLLALGIVLVAGRLTFLVTRDTVIEASVFDVAPQITELRNWKNWYPWAGAGDDLTAMSGNPAAIVVRQRRGGKDMFESLSVLPEADTRYCRVIWSRPLTAWQWIKEFGKGGTTLSGGLAALKKFVEDPRSFYGFDIRIRPVSDTLFLIKEAVVPRGEVRLQGRVLEGDVRRYLAANPGVSGKDTVITGWEPLGAGLVRLAVGIPVNHRGPAADSLVYLKLPAGGRLLTGVYQGSYSRMDGLKRAMDRYLGDKRLQKVAAPFERQAIGAGDTTNTWHELNYPIW